MLTTNISLPTEIENIKIIHFMSCKLIQVWFGWLLWGFTSLSAAFQPYRDLEAGDNQSLKIQMAKPGIEGSKSEDSSLLGQTQRNCMVREGKLQPGLSCYIVSGNINLFHFSLYKHASQAATPAMPKMKQLASMQQFFSSDIKDFFFCISHMSIHLTHTHSQWSDSVLCQTQAREPTKWLKEVDRSPF